MSIKHSNLKSFIEELIEEVQTELDEATTTASVDGYNTPNAFSDGGEKDKKRKKKISTQFGMKIVGKMDESFLSDLDLIKKGSKDITDFVKKVLSNKDYKEVRNDKEFHKYLKSFYNESVVNEGQINEWKLQLDLGKVNPSEFENWANDSLQKKHKIKVSGSGKNWTIVGKGNDDRMGSSADWITQLLGKAWTINKIKVVQKESITEAKIKRPVNRWLELKNDDTMHPHKKMAIGLKELKYQLAETEKFFTWYNKIKTMNELDSSEYWKRTQSHIYKIKERLINIAKTIQEIEK